MAGNEGVYEGEGAGAGSVLVSELQFTEISNHHQIYEVELAAFTYRMVKLPSHIYLYIWVYIYILWDNITPGSVCQSLFALHTMVTSYHQRKLYASFNLSMLTKTDIKYNCNC